LNHENDQIKATNLILVRLNWTTFDHSTRVLHCFLRDFSTNDIDANCDRIQNNVTTFYPTGWNL